MPAPSPIAGAGGPPPFFPWEAAQPIPGIQRGTLAAAFPAGQFWYVRVGGSNNNGGSDNGLAALRTGTDGVANNTTTFTSASAAFTSADVGRGICISTGGTARHHKIASVSNSTTVILDRNCTLNAGGQTWAIGGAWADLRAGAADTAANGDSNSPVAPGDTIWIGAGTYRAVTTFGSLWLTGQTGGGIVRIAGDVTGFFTGDAGMVQLTPYLTNDKTAASGSSTLNLNSRNGLLIQNLYILGGSASSVAIAFAAARNVTVVDCALQSWSDAVITFVGLGGTFHNNVIDRCQLIGTSANAVAGLIDITCPTAGADYDCGITIRNSVLIGGGNPGSVRIHASGALAGKGGGTVVENCMLFGGLQGVNTNDANLSSRIPVRVTGCVIACAGGSLVANTVGQIVEDYNSLASARTNVTAGIHSDAVPYAPLFSFGQERVWGGTPRPFGEPLPGSPWLAFGSDGTQTPYDVRNGPRPTAAARQALGAFQRGNNFTKETSTVHTGSNAISVVGDGFHDFDLAVNAGPLTVSVFCQFDSNYTGPLPRLQVVKGGQVSVGDVEVPFSKNAQGAWEQQQIVINPTTAGIVTVRVIAGDGSGIAKTVFDTFAAA